METPPPTDPQNPFAATGPTVPPANPVGSSHEGYVKGCQCSKCVAQREKWKAKSRSKNNPFSGGKPQPAAVDRPALSIVPKVESDVPTAVPARPFVPWTVELVRPLISQAANLAEKWDGESLIEEARKVSDALAKWLEVRVAWNAEAKGMLVDGASECAVKYLNLSKVSSEYLPEIKTAIAALSILHARQELVTELRKQAAEAKAAKANESTEERKAA